MFVNLDRYGNTSSASIPLFLVEAQRAGLIEDWTLVFLSGVGAGLTWGSAYLTWCELSAA